MKRFEQSDGVTYIRTEREVSQAWIGALAALTVAGLLSRRGFMVPVLVCLVPILGGIALVSVVRRATLRIDAMEGRLEYRETVLIALKEVRCPLDRVRKALAVESRSSAAGSPILDTELRLTFRDRPDLVLLRDENPQKLRLLRDQLNRDLVRAKRIARRGPPGSPSAKMAA